MPPKSFYFLIYVGDGDIEGSVMDEVDDAVVLECQTSTASMLKSAVQVLTILE